MEAAMAADAASATVKKVACRISGSRSNSSISGGTSKSSPRISRNNSSIRRDTSESSPRISGGTSNASDRSRNSSTSGISRDISRSSPHSIKGDGVYLVFVSGVVDSGIFCQSAVQYPPRVFLTRTRARKLLVIHILETTPILGAGLLHHHSHPPRRRTRMDHPFRPSRPRAPSPNRSPWRKLRHQGSCAYRVQALWGTLLYLVVTYTVHSQCSRVAVRMMFEMPTAVRRATQRTIGLEYITSGPSPPGRETITIGNRRKIKVEYNVNMDVIVDCETDQKITLIDVAYLPGLRFSLYSLHAVQRTHMIVSDASRTHIIGENLTFPRSSRGSHLRASRLPAGTVGARRRQGDMHATNLLRQLRHPIPPPP